GELRRGHRAYVPGAQPGHRKDRGGHPRRCSPGEALLPARPAWQGRQDSREAVDYPGAVSRAGYAQRMDARETAIGDEKTSGEAMTVRSPESSHSAGPEPEGMGSGSGDARFGEGRMPDDRADRGRRSRRRAERPKKKGSFWRELPILVVLALGLALLIK